MNKNKNKNEIDTNKQTENQSKKLKVIIIIIVLRNAKYSFWSIFFSSKNKFSFLSHSLSLCVLDSEREYFRLKKLFTTTNIEQKQIKPTHTEWYSDLNRIRVELKNNLLQKQTKTNKPKKPSKFSFHFIDSKFALTMVQSNESINHCFSIFALGLPLKAMVEVAWTVVISLL